ncbi:unnamed protein product, partial [Meganyctiphanes norvegica]
GSGDEELVITLQEGHLYPPEEGWGSSTYNCVYPGKDNKRKFEDARDSPVTPKTQRTEKRNQCSDLVVLGLPWSTTDQVLRNAFSEYGEVLMAQVKKDGKTGKSKGFGFIRFAEYETQVRVVNKRHFVDGRQCEVKYPQQFNSKVFIGRLTEDISADELKEYFGQFGEISNVYIPSPFRGFAFISFDDPAVAQSLRGEDHIVKGTSLHVASATRKPTNQHNNQQGNQLAAQGNKGNQVNQGNPVNQGGLDLNQLMNMNMNALALPMLAQIATAAASQGNNQGGFNQGGPPPGLNMANLAQGAPNNQGGNGNPLNLMFAALQGNQGGGGLNMNQGMNQGSGNNPLNVLAGIGLAALAQSSGANLNLGNLLGGGGGVGGGGNNSSPGNNGSGGNYGSGGSGRRTW